MKVLRQVAREMAFELPRKTRGKNTNYALVDPCATLLADRETMAKARADVDKILEPNKKKLKCNF